MKTLIKITYAVFVLLCFTFYSRAQVQNQYNTVTTGASFLLISPDARNTGVAEAGTGLMSDANSGFINGAKLSFADKTGLSVSYVPWLREIDKNLHLGNLSAYHQFGDRETIGLSLKYLDLGSINFRDESGGLLQQYQASEFSIDGTYSRKFGDALAIALTGRYIRSDLGMGTFNGMEVSAVNGYAADISVYSEKTLTNSRYAWGVSLTNIGTKLKYSSTPGGESFLPMNLRIGGGFTLLKNKSNSLTFLLDVNKLMVPTPPRYKLDPNGITTTEIEKGKDPNRSVPNALFSSLFDAPGGFREEISEFTIAGGLEFSYQNQFFIRSGYFYEDPEKGNRQHFAAGIGLKLKPFQFDMSYIAPTSKRYVLRNGIKFTLSYSID
ncbi:type IX secretion system outer membrane channel protein PorV [Pedobacter fastidiosus]|uniref:Type IX secretion system outer membrane channel protein PorV n=1 Tax=Pedobacter fastidiosus TaxID=2765361 RepID=A0ABR7KW92_9SPHI|nr:type IX secretion system outer membrane channel protein PorV [Pedobacter fastidiosus]MBC6112311.1 type IX secretion system outer membrane channel protein PorV [Pedobacter fastidiosus]